jgi:uncharacterized membrane protein YeaQ/YmgE (transglycosylase-associated protein family)
MGLVAWITIGILAGLITTSWQGGDSGPSAVTSAGLGAAGALAGGLVAAAFGDGRVGSFFNVATWVVAAAGAFLSLLAFDSFLDRDADRHDQGAGP